MARTDHLLDTSGLNCPLPVLKARKAMKGLANGERLTVIATDPASSIDFRHFCHVAGHLLEKQTEKDGVLEFVIRKSAPA
ncbi:sulfurtransferase TusA family protein [Sneathiella sp.]|uniref:sulfurtransferase TusA family protein n=1 Tax=Sneathiella sp. TaxID=1964365 RepID=UPI00356275A7